MPNDIGCFGGILDLSHLSLSLSRSRSLALSLFSLSDLYLSVCLYHVYVYLPVPSVYGMERPMYISVLINSVLLLPSIVTSESVSGGVCNIHVLPVVCCSDIICLPSADGTGISVWEGCCRRQYRSRRQASR